MNRRRAVAALAASVLFAAAVPAWAHSTIEPQTVPPSSDQRLTAKVPVEPGQHSGPEPDVNKRHNTRVTVEIPDGFTATACEPKPGWSCQVVAKSDKVPHHVAYNRQAGPFEKTDVFAFAVRTPAKAGDYAFEINQTYSEGDVSHWDGPPGSANPAAIVKVQ